MDKTFKSYLVEDRSYVAYIKREIHREIMQYSFTQTQVGEINIIVSELLSNLVKHAGKGELLYRARVAPAGHSVFEIIGIDNGPGMANPSQMMKDGVSTTRTLGQGLGAMSRLSSTFQVYSMPGWGTVAYSCYSSKVEKTTRKKGNELQVSTLFVNKPNERVCGDGYEITRTDTSVRIFFGDGLGHGEHAHNATEKAREAFMESSATEPADILREMHEKVRRTRGLVATIAILDKKQNIWKVCGVGNIMARLYTGITYKNYMAYNGTLGLNIPTSMKDSTFEVEKNQHLIMNSDGIRSRWDLTRYPTIFKYENIVLGAAVYKDFTRRNDDASLLIAKVI